MIRAQQLSKDYGSLRAVRSLDLDIAGGEIFGFLGPNGAGKTTTIRLMTGTLRPTSGTATVAGYDVTKQPLEVKRRIGYLADPPYLYEKVTGWEFVQFVADLYGVSRDVAARRADRFLRLVEMESRAHDLIESYSHGMRQKIALAASLCHDPEVLFLDEPTSGLDPRSARAIKDLLVELARRGKTVFLSTHVLEIAEHMCDRVGIINDGELVALGTVHDLRAEAQHGDATLEEIFLQVTGGREVEELAHYLEEV